jgi:D-alanyl-lipoteichoic acid acyltransferase DltB (MBOAT superfamily)
MQFTQPIFFIFVVCFFVGWRWIDPRSNFRLTYLVIASFIFYSWADWRHLLVLIAVGLISFWGAIGMENRPRAKLPLLVGAVAASLGILLAFKYAVFLAANLESLLALFGWKLAHKTITVGVNRVPPLGISFYILQSVGYLLDVYAGRLQPTRDVTHYFAYLALFPKLLAGPIERGKDLLPQLAADRLSPTERQRWEGTKLIVFGYFTKVVIADNLAPFVDAAFNAPTVRGESLYWWVAVTAFAIQLYSDFSGYSAIAVGLGKWMGYDLTLNFNHPYTAASLAEFWARWHISLTNWLKEHIFFPLCRSRLGRSRPHLNMWITMLLSGFWHGAAWHFIAWGGLFGLFISLERWSQWPNKLKRYRGGYWAALFLVMVQVWVGWVFFRAASLSQGLQIVQVMFRFRGGLDLRTNLAYLIFLSLGIVPEIYSLLHVGQKPLIPTVLKNRLEVVFVSLLMVATVLLRGPGSQFIYFQF